MFASGIARKNGEGIQPPPLHQFVIGEPFNPWHRACGFYPPEVVGRNRILKDGPKRLYECLVRRAGRNGECFPAHVTIAKDLGKSVAQVKRDYKALVENKLVRHRSRDGRRSNTYEFLWHPWFERSPLSHQSSFIGSQHPGAEGSGLSSQGEAELPPESSPAHSQIDSSPASEPPREVRSENLTAHQRARNSVQEFNTGNSSSSASDGTGRFRRGTAAGTVEAEEDDESSLSKITKPSLSELGLLAGFLKEYLGQTIGNWPDKKSVSLEAPPSYLVGECFNRAPRWTAGDIIEALRANMTVSPGRPKSYSWFPVVVNDLYIKRQGVAPAPFVTAPPDQIGPPTKTGNPKSEKQLPECARCGSSGIVGGLKTPAEWCTCAYAHQAQMSNPSAVDDHNRETEKLRRRHPNWYETNDAA